MGNNLFNARIAERIGKALGKRLLPVTLIKVTQGDRDTSNLTAARPENKRRYPCRGIIDTYDQRRFQSTAIEQGVPVVLILGGTLPTGIEPNPDDRVIVNKTEYEIVGPVISDPDLAAYIAQTNGSGS